MSKFKLILKENWKDPVWSKVIAAGIISILGVLITSIHSLITTIFSKISFKQALIKTLDFLNYSISIKIWVFILCLCTYFIFIFKPFVKLIKEIIFKINSSKKIKKKKAELPIINEESTTLFNYRVARAFPGARGITWFKNPITAVKRLEILLQKPLMFKTNNIEFNTDPIWWFRGYSSLQIEKFEKIGKKRISINIQELKIKKIAVYTDGSYYKDFIYVECEGEKQTGINEFSLEDIKRNIESFGYCSEEFAIIKNKFGWSTPIRREHYDDGSTVVRGKVKEINNAKLKVKFITDYNFIIAAKESPYNSIKFESKSKQFLNGILSKDVSYQEFFDFMKSFNKYEN